MSLAEAKCFYGLELEPLCLKNFASRCRNFAKTVFAEKVSVYKCYEFRKRSV